MKNKILIQLLVPNLAQSYNIYIPINERIGKIVEMIKTGLLDLTNEDQFLSQNFVLVDTSSGKFYENDLIVRDTTIRNGTSLLFLPQM